MLATTVPFPATISEFWSQFTGGGADAHPLIQFVKYAFVGGLSTGVHILSFFLAGWFLFPCVAKDDIIVRILRLKAPEVEEAARARNAVRCNVTAFVISNVFCYILNRIFVFQPGKHGIAVEFMLFFAVSAIAIAIGTVIMRFLIKRFGMQTSLAFASNLVASLMLNFVLRKFLIFNG